MNLLHRYIVPAAQGDSNGSDRVAAHAWSQIYSFGERVTELEVTFLLSEVCTYKVICISGKVAKGVICKIFIIE